MEDGFTKLGRTLDGRAKETFSANSSVNIEMGNITVGLGLKVSRFESEIPRGDYDLSRHLTVNDVSGTVKTSSGGDPSHTHSVDIKRPGGLEQLSAGDRVIVVWDGAQPIVVDVIVRGDL